MIYVVCRSVLAWDNPYVLDHVDVISRHDTLAGAVGSVREQWRRNAQKGLEHRTVYMDDMNVLYCPRPLSSPDEFIHLLPHNVHFCRMFLGPAFGWICREGNANR